MEFAHGSGSLGGSTQARPGAREVVEMGKSARIEKGKGQPSLYVSPNDLVARWRCGRSSVDRIARREGFRRFCPGTGRNGLIRYFLEDVLAFEQANTVAMQA